ncbi:MAG TPA: hypothetical protein VK184_08155 [Nostocaceae cyanobacterium]|nr:hypothetical protein [Nostocaceae cyanobacterium]
MRLKSWESPRRQGRNDKGKGGSARQRQLKKQRQMLRQKLKEANQQDKNQNINHNGEGYDLPLFFCCINIKHSIKHSTFEKICVVEVG